jgi:hypothetical protein
MPFFVLIKWVTSIDVAWPGLLRGAYLRKPPKAIAHSAASQKHSRQITR